MTVLKQSRVPGRLPLGSRIWGDRGYTGLDTLCPKHVITPQMRPRGGTLSEEHRDLNHPISQVRITVENVGCKIKNVRICREFYRNELRHQDPFWAVSPA